MVPNFRRRVIKDERYVSSSYMMKPPEKMNINICEEIEKSKQELSKELRLIASANYASPTVIRAISGEATNIFAEGSVNCRYVGGSDLYNNIENFAIEKAKHLFNAEYANVQLLSGLAGF